MALHSKKSFSILSLFSVALFATVAAGDIYFRPSTSYTVRESEGDIIVEVCSNASMDEGSSTSGNDTINSSGSVPLMVHITFQEQSASKGDDFEVIDDTFELGDDMCLPVNITILNDTVFERNETFIIVATYRNDSLSSTENNISAKITILDDERVQVTIRALDTSVRENDGHVTVCGTVDNELEESVVIDVSSSLMGEDPTTTQETFTNDSREQCFNVTIPNDDIFEDNSTFTVMVTSDQRRVTIVNGSIEIHIQDDDDLVLRVLNDSTIRITEGEPIRTVCLVMELNRDIGRDFSIEIRTSMATAREGEDYGVIPVMETFNSSSVSQIHNMSIIRSCIVVNITDDTIGEPNERFTVQVVGVDPSERLMIVNGMITIIIRDNENVEGIVPENFTASDVQSRNIIFFWDPPSTSAANLAAIIGYTVTCIGSVSMASQDTSSMEITIRGLDPFTNYNCSVFARVEGNRGNSAESITRQTAEEVPGSAPRSISVADRSPYRLSLMWLPPELSYGIITSYTIRIDFTNGTNAMTRTSTSASLSIPGLQPYQTITVIISAINSQGAGPSSNETSFTTDESQSGPVRNLRTSGLNSGTVFSVQWLKPDQPNGVIRNYSIEIYNIGENCNVERGIESSKSVQAPSDDQMMISTTVGNLASGRPYRVRVRAVNSAAESENVSVCNFTQQEVPMAPDGVTVTRNTDDSVVVTWSNLTLTRARGWLINYTIHYWDAGNGNRKSAKNVTTDSVITSHTFSSKDFDSFRTYNVVVTASTVIGEGDDSEIFVLKGRPLPPVATPANNQSGIIAGTIILLLIIAVTIVVIVLVLIRFRRKVFRPRSNTLSRKPLTAPNSIQLTDYHHYGNNGHFDSPPHHASKDIPIEQFSNHVRELHRDSNRLFEHEYRSIKDADYRHDAAFLPCNRDTKNRFIDIFPYDVNRVILKKTADKGSDYINASWINGYQRKKAYIAAQGPRPETVEDFWRMISENQLPTIVMVTRLVEGPKMIEKCSQYWPEKVGHTIRLHRTGMMITLKESKLFADYTINTLSLKQPHSSDELEIAQFSYKGWPDHGVPQYATSLLGFLRHVRRRHTYSDPRPLLVHCSAGVGRTGTFITLDVMLQKIREEGSVNVHEFVKELRRCRCQMVQTESQYVFIHDALNECITCGETEVAVGNLRIVLNKLYKDDSVGFKKQFQLLSEVSRRPTPADLDAANSELHQHKNRYPEKIPYRESGVRLRPSGVLGGEYINATFINGYKCTNSFVAAQAPLESTLETFWRMVWEIKCQTIVLLCDTENKSSCVRFWPETGSATYGKLKITATAKPVEKNDTVKRKFEISFDKEKTNIANSEKLSVTLFHHMEWNEDGDQPSSKSILQLNNDVIKAQISTGNKPIIVACNDGCGRTGTFLSIYSQIERLKTEQVIDVFQWVKSARIQRPWLVSNQEQYELIYEVLSDFIDSFDTYANFQVAGDDL